jgi:hypothetical protein
MVSTRRSPLLNPASKGVVVHALELGERLVFQSTVLELNKQSLAPCCDFLLVATRLAPLC